MKLSSLFCLFMLFILVACGNNERGVKTINLSEDDIQEVLENQNFDCNSITGKTCPEGIARLFLVNRKNKMKSANCSGFMVNETTLITNAHCISTQSRCNDTYIAIYKGNSYEQTRCESIKRVISDNRSEDDPQKKLDVAIIKIKDRYYGKTFKVSNVRPKPFDDVHAWVVDHTGQDQKIKNSNNARITEFKCFVSPNPQTASLHLERCPIVDGNSGSPILNSKNEVVGVLWGGSATNENTSWDLEARRMSEHISVATEAIYFLRYITE